MCKINRFQTYAVFVFISFLPLYRFRLFTITIWYVFLKLYNEHNYIIYSRVGNANVLHFVFGISPVKKIAKSPYYAVKATTEHMR